MKISKNLSLWVAVLGLWGCSHSYPALNLVPAVEIKRYLGTWYEIARLPHYFQKDCLQSQAKYSENTDGTIAVLNSCNTKTGQKSAKAIAKVVKNSGNAHLKVSFFKPFWADYQIISLDEHYQSAMVATPNRKYLWILSRNQTIDPDTLKKYIEQARQSGFDVDALVYRQAK